jgi:hypothetical protein
MTVARGMMTQKHILIGTSLDSMRNLGTTLHVVTIPETTNEDLHQNRNNDIQLSQTSRTCQRIENREGHVVSSAVRQHPCA